MQTDLLEILYEALRSEVGVSVQTNSPERLRAKLYPLRNSDPDLACLSFTISPTAPESELWIIKKGSESAEA